MEPGITPQDLGYVLWEYFWNLKYSKVESRILSNYNEGGRVLFYI
jgi:hypothetical protein